MGNYLLKCPVCGHMTADGYTVTCPVCRGNPAGLLRAVYEKKTLTVHDYDNLFKFIDWLPVHAPLRSKTSPVVFRNESLSKELDLPGLWFGFTGYYPEKKAFAVSCSFKELEALPTFARLFEHCRDTIVVASAGNTGRAFAETAGVFGFPVVVVVPETAVSAIRVSKENTAVRLLAVSGDYADAISVANRIASLNGFVSEGGAGNVARRDGMGTVFLEAALRAGRIPDLYFQAVGSGTGCLAAWEAALRLIGDGRFGNRLPQLHASQNAAFAPLKNAWERHHDDIEPSDVPDGGRHEEPLFAGVLANRSPPYSAAGGFRDAMEACGGSLYAVSEKEARRAAALWASYENAALDPAAAVAFASLIQSVSEGLIDPSRKILLNLTGGGADRAAEDFSLSAVQPHAVVPADASVRDLGELIHV